MTYQYDESVLPNTSESSKEVSKIWANEFSKLIPDVNVLFTSEPYGAYVAEFMSINHLSFDEKRSQISISGSQIRKSLYDSYHFLPDSTKSYFQKKVVLLGTESTGKSTLAHSLSTRFRASLVHELGRDVIPDSNSFSIDQLLQIVAGHTKNIIEAKNSLKPLVIIDTDIHITQSYAKYTLGEYLDLPGSIYDLNRADLYLYLDKDIPYIQDGTRLDEADRNRLDTSHRDTLQDFGIEFEELAGSYEERNRKAFELVKNLLNTFN